MNERFYCFVALVLLVAASLIAAWIYYHLRARRLYGQSWETILTRVTPIDSGNLRIVALDLLGDEGGLNCKDGSSELDPSEIMKLTGGLEGLGDIQANCDALIELACYCQRLYPEVLAVAEELRLNAREIKWHLDRLNAAVQNGMSVAALGEYAQRIATIYYLMTRRLLAIYDAYNVPGAREVQVSLA
jgi:hypothetical protein